MLHLTRCWAPKPRGLVELSLWRLDASTHTGHSRNMKGHEVSNPSRQPVEMSVRHSASTTFHRAKHLFMSEQIGQFSNLFSFPWLQCNERGEREREEEREGAWGDSSAQFMWKHCDTLQGCVLILAPRTILSERLQQQQPCTAGLPALPLHQTASPFTCSPLRPSKINPNTRAKANISLFMYLPPSLILLLPFLIIPSWSPNCSLLLAQRYNGKHSLQCYLGLLAKKSVPDTCLFLFLPHLNRLSDKNMHWSYFCSYEKSSHWPFLMVQLHQDNSMWLFRELPWLIFNI